MGGLLILIALVVGDPAVGRPHQPLCLGRARRHRGLRRDRLLGRLPQGHQAQPQGRAGQAASSCSSIVVGRRRRLADRPGARPPPLRYTLALPFLKDVLMPLGVVGFLAFAILVMVGASNAVNLTDGLDGLAIGPVIMAAGVFGLIAYLVGNAIFANYLYLHHVPRTGELAVLCGAWSARAWASCGSTRRPPWCSWATPARSPIGGALGARRGRHQARDRAGDRRRPVRARDRVGDRAGRCPSS